MNHSGKLYLLPLPLGDLYPNCFSELHQSILSSNQHFAVENIKPVRRYLVKNNISIEHVKWFEIGKHADPNIHSILIQKLLGGTNIVLMSDCGCPAIADPGAMLVRRAQAEGMSICPLPGVSSITMALMASGLQGQSFRFHGYLPIQSAALKKALSAINREIEKEGATQICIETPHRNIKLYQAILQHLNPFIFLCIASSIHTSNEYIKTKSIQAWKQTPIKILENAVHKKPAVFLMGRKG